MKNILILAILFLGVAFAEDAKLSDTDKALLDKATSSHLEAAEKAYSTYLKAVNEAGVKTLKDLEKVKADAMKKGNLALANAVDAKEKEVKAGSLGDVVVADANTDLLGNSTVVDLNKEILGKWKRDDLDIYFVFHDDNTITLEGQNIALVGWTGVTGKWSINERNNKVEGSILTMKWSRKDMDDTIATFADKNVFTMGDRKAVKMP